MSPHRIRQLPSPEAFTSYAISDNGFLPAEAPLSVLPHASYEPWESIVARLSLLVRMREIRGEIDRLPVLSTAHLRTEPEWQRAYSVLALLSQGYIWQGPRPSEHLPPAISVPFLEVASHLEVVPVATYASLNLWNWRPISDGVDIRQPENQRTLHTFTGTEDENWFFVVSNAMEARAGPLMKQMLSAIEACDRNDTPHVTTCLDEMRQSLQQIQQLLERMDERCRPQVFYHEIRPFLAGSTNMEANGLPKGVFFDEGDGKGTWRKYRGGSNGQSSLIQFFDVILGVEHTKTADFHSEMREYMPGPHARFLNDVESIANIRSYVGHHEDDRTLVEAYNSAVAALSAFRDAHIRLVTKFIIIPSRTPRDTGDAPVVDAAALASKPRDQNVNSKDLIGTGGTKLVPFLRESRDETAATTLAT